MTVVPTLAQVTSGVVAGDANDQVAFSPALRVFFHGNYRRSELHPAVAVRRESVLTQQQGNRRSYTFRSKAVMVCLEVIARNADVQ